MKINAELITKLRKNKSWSQDELAIASGLNLRTIQRIEKEGVASLQSKKALAATLGVDTQDLDHKQQVPMKTCPQCHSENTYRYKKELPSACGGGSDHLPHLSTGLFSSAQFTPIICADCGYLRWFVSKASTEKLETSKHWLKL